MRKAELVGLVQVRGHCTFSWKRAEGETERTAAALPTHCAACIEELVRLGYRIDTSSTPGPTG